MRACLHRQKVSARRMGGGAHVRTLLASRAASGTGSAAAPAKGRTPAKGGGGAVRVVVLGGGFGGLIAAYEVRKGLPSLSAPARLADERGFHPLRGHHGIHGSSRCVCGG